MNFGADFHEDDQHIESNIYESTNGITQDGANSS